MMVQVQAPPVPPVPPIDPNLILLQDGLSPAIVVIVAFALLAATVVLWPVMRALGRRLEGKGADAALRDEVERLQHRLEEVDALQARLAELEERVDFTERMLVRGQEAAEPGRLPQG